MQRREYIRLQKLKRERQLRRAQTVPAESTSGSSGELQVSLYLEYNTYLVVQKPGIPVSREAPAWILHKNVACRGRNSTEISDWLVLAHENSGLNGRQSDNSQIAEELRKFQVLR